MAAPMPQGAKHAAAGLDALAAVGKVRFPLASGRVPLRREPSLESPTRRGPSEGSVWSTTSNAHWQRRTTRRSSGSRSVTTDMA